LNPPADELTVMLAQRHLSRRRQPHRRMRPAEQSQLTMPLCSRLAKIASAAKYSTATTTRAFRLKSLRFKKFDIRCRGLNSCLSVLRPTLS
jgi:hypothetical protein